jgi:hypothetical protein
MVEHAEAEGEVGRLARFERRPKRVWKLLV